MAGLFPAVAHFPPGASEAIPVELTLKRTTWLGGPGQRVRGYRSTDWWMEPLEDLSGCVAELTYQYDVVESFPAAGSRLSLHGAAQPELFSNIFFPRACRPAMAGSRPSMP
jgi:hypothetical protein